MANTELVEQEQPTLTTSSNKICDNCKQPLGGQFCGQCGQNSESTLKYFWSVVLHLLDDIFSFDSRASRTIWPLMFRPGFLTNEYIAGRRVHYVPPLRLYLFISIVFFISLNFFTVTESTMSNKEDIAQLNTQISQFEEYVNQQLTAEEQSNKHQLISEMKIQMKQIGTNISLKHKGYVVLMQKILSTELAISQKEQLSAKKMEKLKKNHLVWKNLIEDHEEIDSGVSFSNNEDGSFTFDWLSDESNKKLDNFTKTIEKKTEESSFETLFKQAISKLPQLMFVLLPLFAVLLKIMYLFSKRLYLEHLTVALHSHGFIFLSFMLLTMFDALYDYSELHIALIKEPIYYLSIALSIWGPVYLFIMQKRIYKQGYIVTFVKFSIIGILYSLLISFTFLAAFIWGVTDLPGS